MVKLLFVADDTIEAAQGDKDVGVVRCRAGRWEEDAELRKEEAGDAETKWAGFVMAARTR